MRHGVVRLASLGLCGLLWVAPAWAFVIGERVAGAPGGVAVRSTPDFSGTRLGTHAAGDLGTITSGPQTGDGFTWWQINFDAGVDGWCTEPNFVTAPVQLIPGPPSAPILTSTPTPVLGSVKLGWSANTEPDLAGYKVYRRTGTGGYGAPLTTLIGSVLTYTSAGLAPGQYFFVVTAYDVTGNESAVSNEVSKTIP